LVEIFVAVCIIQFYLTGLPLFESLYKYAKKKLQNNLVFIRNI